MIEKVPQEPNKETAISNAGDAKVLEYVARIQAGESKESIFEGLPNSFKLAIEEKLGSQAGEVSAPEKADGTIPEEFLAKAREAVLNNTLNERAAAEEKNIKQFQEAERIAQLKNELKGSEGSKEDNLRGRIESNQVSFANLESIIANGGGQLEVVVNGEKIDFEEFAVGIDGTSAEVVFVRKKDQTKNPGIGVPIYVELGKRLAEKGIVLSSSGAQYGPGRSVWQNLVTLGMAKKAGTGWEFVGENRESEPEIKVGMEVTYKGEKRIVRDIIDHTYQSGRKVKLYYLDGVIERGSRRYMTRENFEV